MKKIRGASGLAANTALRGKDASRRRKPHHSQKEEFAQLMAKKEGEHKEKRGDLHKRSAPGHDPALRRAAGDQEGDNATQAFHHRPEQKEQRGEPGAPSALSQQARGAGRGDAPADEALPQQARGAGRGDAPVAEGMGEKILRSRGGARREASAEPNEAAAAMASGMSAPAQRGGDVAAPATELATSATSPAEVNQLIDKTVNRILVSSPDSGQPQEVRLQLDGKLLGGTEVRIANVDGQLNVEFLPSTADAGNFLSQQHDHIQEALSKNLRQQKVAVEINHEAHERGSGMKRGHSRVERKPGTQSFR